MVIHTQKNVTYKKRFNIGIQLEQYVWQINDKFSLPLYSYLKIYLFKTKLHGYTRLIERALFISTSLNNTEHVVNLCWGNNHFLKFKGPLFYFIQETLLKEAPGHGISWFS